MSTDIRFVIETQTTDGKWIGVAFSDVMNWEACRAKRQDYLFFNELAEIRGRAKHFKPDIRGRPHDASTLTTAFLEYWRDDGHNISYMSIDEFVNIYMTVHPELRDEPEYITDKHTVFGCFFDNETFVKTARIVFWFDC